MALTVSRRVPKPGSFKDLDFPEKFRWASPGFNRKVTLVSSAELLALFTTAKEIAPAPGRGNGLIFDGISVEYLPGTVPYTVGGGVDLRVYLGPVAAARHVGLVPSASLLVGAAATDDDGVALAQNLVNGTALTLTAGAANLAGPMQISVTLVDTTPSITRGTISITGTGEDGQPQADEIELAASTLTYISNKAFKTVTQVMPSGIATLGGGGDETIKVGIAAPNRVVMARAEDLSQPIYENLALLLAMDTANPTLGNGTLVVDARYRIVPTRVAAG